MTVTIGRRELLAAVGGAAAAWPIAARAQQAEKLRAIGYLNPGQSWFASMSTSSWQSERPGRSRPSGPPRPFQLSWQPPATRWGAGSSPVWRGPAVTSRE